MPDNPNRASQLAEKLRTRVRPSRTAPTLGLDEQNAWVVVTSPSRVHGPPPVYSEPGVEGRAVADKLDRVIFELPTAGPETVHFLGLGGVSRSLQASVLIDYEAAVVGGLRVVPDGAAQELLAEDYAGMVRHGLVFEDAPDFTSLVAQCRAIQNRVNQV